MALNIADLAEHAIDAVPDRVALICGDEQLTYAQLEEKANRLAHYLIDRGVKKDDKVGLYCRNRIEIVIAMLGIVKAGAILVNVNFRYVEGELKYLFENSDMVACDLYSAGSLRGGFGIGADGRDVRRSIGNRVAAAHEVAAFAADAFDVDILIRLGLEEF